MKVLKSTNLFLLSLTLGFFLTFSITSESIGQVSVNCNEIPTSIEEVPQNLIDACGNSEAVEKSLETRGTVTTKNLGSTAFGSEASLDNLVSLVLGAPEVLNPIGPLDSPSSDFIGGCDFDNSGTFLEIYCIDSPGNLFTVNTSNAARTDIGTAAQFGSESFTGLAMEPNTDVMYAVSTNLASSSLFIIDLNTAQATRIGPITNSPGMIAAAFDNSGQLYGYDVATDNFIRINKDTGAGTIIGPLGFDANFGQGMDFDETDNTCYMFAFNLSLFRPELRECHTSNGSSDLIGVLGSIEPGALVQIGGAGIATGGNFISNVPALNTAGLALTALLLMAGGAYYLRRSGKKTKA